MTARAAQEVEKGFLHSGCTSYFTQLLLGVFERVKRII
jgi:hypothetical protein